VHAISICSGRGPRRIARSAHRGARPTNRGRFGLVRSRWFEELAAGRAASVPEIARREGVNVSYVGRLIRVAFLAPEIVEAIAAGRQPASLTADLLTRRTRLCADWAEESVGVRRQTCALNGEIDAQVSRQAAEARTGVEVRLLIHGRPVALRA